MDTISSSLGFIYFICDENLLVFHIVTQGKWTMIFGKVK